MKNTIVVLIVFLLSMPIFAQYDATVVYPQLNSFIQSEKNNHGLLRCNNNQCDYKRFIELYNQQNHIVKKTTTRRVTFMDGPVVFSSTPVETGGNFTLLHAQYRSGDIKPSTALEVLGIIGGMVAGAFYPSYVGRTYHSSGATVQAYLESSRRQHER